MKRNRLLLIIVFLSTSLCFSTYAVGATEEETNTIDVESTDTVRFVQQLLNDLGYDCGTPDGIAGAKTEVAIKEYQKEQGINETGIIDKELLTALSIKEDNGTLYVEKPEENSSELDTAEESIQKIIESNGIEPFLGKWVSIYRDIINEDFVYDQNGMFGGSGWEEYDSHRKTVNVKDINITASAIINDSMIKTGDSTFEIVMENGILLLVSSEGNTYVREEDYESVFNNRFVRVTLTTENVADYIGPFMYIGDALDEWDDKYADLIIMTSPAYNNGLIMLTFNDVQYEINIDGGTFTLDEPYKALTGYGNPVFYSFGRAKGEILYVKSEYVKNIKEGPCVTKNGYPLQARTFEFSDGFTFDFFVSEWPKSNATKEAFLQY